MFWTIHNSIFFYPTIFTILFPTFFTSECLPNDEELESMALRVIDMAPDGSIIFDL